MFKGLYFGLKILINYQSQVIIAFLLPMLLQILLNHLIGDILSTPCSMAFCPKVFYQMAVA